MGRFRPARAEIAVTLLVAVTVGALIALPGLLTDRSSDRLQTQAAPTTTAPEVTTTLETLPPDTAGSPAAAEQPPTTTTPETIALPAPPATTPAPPTTEAARSGSGRSHATTTVHRDPPPCHNSTEPRCGAFRWDPAPGDNAPMSLSIDPTSNETHAGEAVVFQVQANDPDGRVDGPSGCGYAVGWGDGTSSGGCRHTPSCPSRYGPWDPPAPSAGSYSGKLTHVYSVPGRYTVEIELNVNGRCYDPYGSPGRATVSVEVNR